MFANIELVGDGCKIMGVFCDTRLRVESAVLTFWDEASCKLQTILPTNQFYNTGATMNLYKARLLGFIEYRTLAIYHSAMYLLNKIDSFQNRSIRAIGLIPKIAWREFKLASLIS